MKIVGEIITIAELRQMAIKTFGDMIKVVVDVDREIIAIDAELHSDLEALILENGSKQKDLWGINIYPEMHGDEFVEFDSLINIRPSQGNRTRNVENEETRKKIISIVAKRVK